MPVRPVLQLGDPVLREKAVAVEDPRRARSKIWFAISPTRWLIGVP